MTEREALLLKNARDAVAYAGRNIAGYRDDEVLFLHLHISPRTHRALLDLVEAALLPAVEPGKDAVERASNLLAEAKHAVGAWHGWQGDQYPEGSRHVSLIARLAGTLADTVSRKEFDRCDEAYTIAIVALRNILAEWGRDPVTNLTDWQRCVDRIHDRARKAIDASEAAFTAASPWREGWRTMESAPKSTSQDTPHGKYVRGVYLLGFCPDESAIDPLGCIDAIWWEPNENNGRGCWYSENGECHPTHWMPLPAPPPGQETK